MPEGVPSSSSARARAGDGERGGFFERVYDIVEQIPPGFVATYGQVARLAGEPRRARQVGYAMRANARGDATPCHRVVFADGALAAGRAFGGEGVQRALLEAEGVLFRDDAHVDLTRSRWGAGL